MKRLLLLLTAPLLMISCATTQHPSTGTTIPVLVWHGQTGTYDAALGPHGGWRFSNGVTATYDPTLGPHGGYYFSDGETAFYDPSLGNGAGGYRYTTGHVVHHVKEHAGGAVTQPSQ